MSLLTTEETCVSRIKLSLISPNPTIKMRGLKAIREAIKNQNTTLINELVKLETTRVFCEILNVHTDVNLIVELGKCLPGFLQSGYLYERNFDGNLLQSIDRCLKGLCVDKHVTIFRILTNFVMKLIIQMKRRGDNEMQQLFKNCLPLVSTFATIIDTINCEETRVNSVRIYVEIFDDKLVKMGRKNIEERYVKALLRGSANFFRKIAMVDNKYFGLSIQIINKLVKILNPNEQFKNIDNSMNQTSELGGELGNPDAGDVQFLFRNVILIFFKSPGVFNAIGINLQNLVQCLEAIYKQMPHELGTFSLTAIILSRQFLITNLLKHNATSNIQFDQVIFEILSFASIHTLNVKPNVMITINQSNRVEFTSALRRGLGTVLRKPKEYHTFTELFIKHDAYVTFASLMFVYFCCMPECKIESLSISWTDLIRLAIDVELKNFIYQNPVVFKVYLFVLTATVAEEDKLFTFSSNYKKIINQLLNHAQKNMAYYLTYHPTTMEFLFTTPYCFAQFQQEAVSELVKVHLQRKVIIKFITGTTVHCLSMWWPPDKSTSGLINFISFLVVAGLTFYNFTSTIFHGPGFLPYNWKPTNESDFKYLQWCNICEGYKAPRAHHCRKCNRCVLKMDHHCPWVNGCVGWSNHAHFTSFLAFAFIGTCHSSVILGCSLYHALHRVWYIYHGTGLEPHVHLQFPGFVMCVAALGLSIGVVLAIGTLLFFQVRAIVRNRTGIEDWIIEKALHRRANNARAGETFDTKKLKPFVFPYDLGIWRNIKQVVNLSCSPIGDGIHWDVVFGCDQFTLTTEQLEQKCEKKKRTRFYQIIRAASGSWVPIMQGIGVCLHPPCTDEPRMKLNVGDIISVTVWKKYWLFGHKLLPDYTNVDHYRLRGWFPRRCAVEIDKPAMNGNRLLVTEKQCTQLQKEQTSENLKVKKQN